MDLESRLYTKALSMKEPGNTTNSMASVSLSSDKYVNAIISIRHFER